MNLLLPHRALISVTEKTGIVDFAKHLLQWDIEIISTGGTLSHLKQAGIPAIPVSTITGFPEILDGRVKTLHPNIHAALLAVADNPEHVRQLRDHGITPIDLIIVNLYPFEDTIGREKTSLADAVEQIDIGGPAMLRSSAKNFRFKTVIVDPGDYPLVLNEMERNSGSISEETRFTLARKVFAHTARYDAVIAEYLERRSPEAKEIELPESFSFGLKKEMTLRYGENPHQKAALYGQFGTFFTKLHGKELSFNNIVDIQSAVGILEEFSEPTVTIVKHSNPCGVGSAKNLCDAYQKALSTDPTSAFGGIIAVNRPLDIGTAEAIDKVFTEVIIAPEYMPGTVEFLTKKRDRRLIKQLRQVGSERRFSLKQIASGVLMQTADNQLYDPAQLRVVTRRSPTPEERAAMEFGWRVAKHVKSNAIVYARSDRTLGIGAGQMSRVDSSRIAVMKARDAALDLAGSAVASDAFFPFADGLLEAVKAGATAVIQPGGSVRDQEVIDAANENNVAMLFTGMRHFNH